MKSKITSSAGVNRYNTTIIKWSPVRPSYRSRLKSACSSIESRLRTAWLSMSKPVSGALTLQKKQAQTTARPNCWDRNENSRISQTWPRPPTSVRLTLKTQHTTVKKSTALRPWLPVLYVYKSSQMKTAFFKGMHRTFRFQPISAIYNKKWLSKNKRIETISRSNFKHARSENVIGVALSILSSLEPSTASRVPPDFPWKCA